MLSRAQKSKIVNEFAEILKSSENILFLDFTGLSTAEMILLKRELKKQGMGYKVVKKSLLPLAFKKAGARSFDFSAHKGSVSLAYNSEDPAVMAKILDVFAKVHQKLLILGGILGGDILLGPDITVLARLGSRDVLLAQLAGVLNWPLTGLVRVLGVNLDNLVRVLGRIRS